MADHVVYSINENGIQSKKNIVASIISNELYISNTNASSSPEDLNSALAVAGGASIQKNMNVRQQLRLNESTTRPVAPVGADELVLENGTGGTSTGMSMSIDGASGSAKISYLKSDGTERGFIDYSYDGVPTSDCLTLNSGSYGVKIGGIDSELLTNQVNSEKYKYQVLAGDPAPPAFARFGRWLPK